MSTEKKQGNEMLQLCGVLFAITFITALLLGVVNQVTAPKIAENEQAAINEAMALLIPNAEFTSVDVDADTAAETGETIATVYEASTGGYCVEVHPTGFGGELTVIVGVAGDGTIAGAQVTSHSETAGLGAKCTTDWINQYAGMEASGSLAVTKDGGSVEPITGATITSRAVTRAVNAAANYVATLS
jgi:electron transport complex protein RnfG